ncbi:MAG: UDP-galactose-4-epimerase [Flaviaesturariibacter sp.]|nr:UDP-galactose-4-epimerase [Flaviaesturariibacter sp.]
MKKKILVTGGCGYIGSHTVIDLVENGFDVVSIDNYSRSAREIPGRVESITGKPFVNHEADLTDLDAVHAVFETEADIAGVIHFAAYKSVPESVADPLLYYRNNIDGLVNLLTVMQEREITAFVFSSSCSVYGDVDELPVKETTPLVHIKSPYGKTKWMGEEIITDMAAARKDLSCILLRYFNPVGAHPSVKLGELPLQKPGNLFPVITGVGVGKFPKMTVFGDRFDTRDGTCVRDFIHVMDIAHAHTLALRQMLEGSGQVVEIVNLGTGNGVTILEAIRMFEQVSGKALNYEVGPEREGDVIAIYADNEKARTLLGWTPKHDLESMMRTAWNWEQELAGQTEHSPVKQH